MTQPIVALAGSTGDLGERLCKALVARGASVRALLRPEAAEADAARLLELGATPVRADPQDVAALATALEGASCVVSALNGLREVIVGRQGVLLDAAVRAGVPRFIPSDYAADFTKTRPGDNRNFDLRREFMARADRAPLQVTSILNGAFMDMLGREMPLIQPAIHRVLYWQDADQLLDFTAKDDVAAYTAAVATDARTAPRFLRIAGESLSARGLAAAVSEVSGERYRTLWAGNLATLGLMIRVAKRLAPQPDAVFPPWQGMQYSRDMFSGRGKLQPLDNARYPELRWTSVRQLLAQRPR
ncbi:NmrA family protein [Aggregicoccus sp. 17bor-14]|uniref:NmrA family NAD(P)-binding protein n=1 Tax=Myxococcaceae TaxID=31 RepID=UPI0012EFE82C|nr:NmrA family NAD(P)-binding protein [Simulacricoccus sp. 17bor-14]MRI88040.1 NmrA family protein [Aggregicoccus sp. 17bor-14]